MSGIKDSRGGTKEVGRVTVGITAVKVQSASQTTRSWMGKNKGPGVVYVGDASVTATSGDYLDIAVGDTVVLDQSADDLWMISDQAATKVPFIREVAPA